MFDANYNYKIISNYQFDEKFLISKKDNSKYKKYLLLVINDNGKKIYKEVENENIEKENYISYYNIEEIISSCNNFDSIFIYAKYYRIEDKIAFIKYKLLDPDLSEEFRKNDNDKIENILKEL